MTEHHAPYSEFDAAEAGHVLGAEPAARRDVAYGVGDALAVGETELEVFPAAAVVRVTTPDARLELYRVPSYGVDPDAGRVVFELGAEEQRSRLLLRRDGRVSFHPVLRATDAFTTSEPAAGGQKASPAAVPSSEDTTAPSGSPDATQERQEVGALLLTGRLGQNPRSGTEGDDIVARFPLALAELRPGQRRWHDIVVQGEPGVQQAEQLIKGDLVRVAGSYVTHDELLPGQKRVEFYTQGVEVVDKVKRRSTRPPRTR